MFHITLSKAGVNGQNMFQQVMFQLFSAVIEILFNMWLPLPTIVQI